MKRFRTLYLKEIKNLYRELLIILVLQVVFILYFLFVIVNHSPVLSEFEKFSIELFNCSVLLYPVLLLYSLYIENRTDTVYQALSLPVRRMMLPAKFAVVLSAFFVSVIVLITVLITGDKAGFIKGSPDVSTAAVYNLAFPTFITICLACAAWGTMQIVRQNRLVVGLAVVLCGFAVYMVLMEMDGNFQRSHIVTMVFHLCLTLGLGFVYACIGCIVYEKFAEI